ncbi:MAG: peptidoglycan DD-metalloendopeptidase family protein [Bacteroidales bacterium]|nr:peptidoglycan DD-metalloendopeptidase family protein [Bacteroidales bacterium]
MLKRRHVEILILVLLALIVILISHKYSPENITDKSNVQSELLTEVEYKSEYGIVVDSINVIRGKVKRNENLSEILSAYGVDYSVIDVIARKSKETFDVRKIRAGNDYTLLCSNDSSAKVLYLIYEISPVNYVVFDLTDTVDIVTGEKEVVREISNASGTITSSLWNAMIDNNTNPNLANDLSEIYAWTIDFFGIQKGDTYKVIYEELFVEGRSIGTGKVLSSWFNHYGKDYFAIYFHHDSIADYYDDLGGSMRRTFLKAPLRFRRISSRFSNSRLHPILKIRRPHHGVDYAAAVGTPVHAVGEGIVIKAQRSGGAGRMVKIKHNGTYSTAYLHLSKYGKGIKKGVYVKQGDVIGYVGSSGLSTGPHLDFRFYRNGKAIDPLKVESPPANPVDTAYLDVYYEVVDRMKEQLDSIIVK